MISHAPPLLRPATSLIQSMPPYSQRLACLLQLRRICGNMSLLHVSPPLCTNACRLRGGPPLHFHPHRLLHLNLSDSVLSNRSLLVLLFTIALALASSSLVLLICTSIYRPSLPPTLTAVEADRSPLSFVVRCPIPFVYFQPLYQGF